MITNVHDTTTGLPQAVETKQIYKNLIELVEQPFNAQFSSIDFLNICTCEDYIWKNTLVTKKAGEIEKAAAKKLAFQYRSIELKKARARRNVATTKIDYTAFAQVMAHVSTERMVRLWQARASTFLVYNKYVSQSHLYSALRDVPLKTLFDWSHDYRQEMRVLLENSAVDPVDLLMPFTRAALAKHRHNAELLVTYYSKNAGRPRTFEVLAPAFPHGSNFIMDRRALRNYIRDCAEEIEFFASQLLDTRDRQILVSRRGAGSVICFESKEEESGEETEEEVKGEADKVEEQGDEEEMVEEQGDEEAEYLKERREEAAEKERKGKKAGRKGGEGKADFDELTTIEKLFYIYMFSLHKRGGNRLAENPYSQIISQQHDVKSYFHEIHQALLRLHRHLRSRLSLWRRSNTFPCSAELSRIWLNRISCLARGLETAYWVCRIVRQRRSIMHSLLFPVFVDVNEEKNEVRLHMNV